MNSSNNQELQPLVVTQCTSLLPLRLAVVLKGGCCWSVTDFFTSFLHLKPTCLYSPDTVGLAEKSNKTVLPRYEGNRMRLYSWSLTTFKKTKQKILFFSSVMAERVVSQRKYDMQSVKKGKIHASKLTGKEARNTKQTVLVYCTKVQAGHYRQWIYLWNMGEAWKTTCSHSPYWNKESWILSQERNKTLILSLF